MNPQRIIGYVLVKQYPGCRFTIGQFEKYTTGEFSNYPEFWQPVFATYRPAVAPKFYTNGILVNESTIDTGDYLIEIAVLAKK